MPDYRRLIVPNQTYFFTVVTYERVPWLTTEIARNNLRSAILSVKKYRPFKIDAMVLLPDHLHCIWTLPEQDGDYSRRWQLIKKYVTHNCAEQLNISAAITSSRQSRQEKNLWQRRFWEHYIRDEDDYFNHCDYIHNNPVKHGFCDSPNQWEYSTFQRFVRDNLYSLDWGKSGNFINDFGCE